MAKENDTETNKNKLPQSTIRVVDIIMRMLQGEKINLDEAASYYNAKPRTIYRDLQAIRENQIFNSQYVMERDSTQKTNVVLSDGKISAQEIFVVLKIIMGTRALSKVEFDEISRQLRKLVSTKEQRQLDKFLKLEYNPVKTIDNMIERIDEFNGFIERRQAIEFTYQGSLPTSDNTRKRLATPLSVYFSDFYFYVLMNSKDKGTRVYRLDRILKYSPSSDRRMIPSNQREDESSIRNFTYLLNGGEKHYYKIAYRGYPQTALDRLPGSRIMMKDDKYIRRPDGSVIIEGYLFTQGMKHWILGQGTFVEVLEPSSLISEVKRELQKSLDQYK